MYIERVPNRNSLPAVLLRESFRQEGKVRNRTLANLSHLPDDKIDALRAVLRGQTTVGPLNRIFRIRRTFPHGHVAAVLGTLRKLGLDTIIAPRRSAQRDRVLAMIVARIIDPQSKLATARGSDDETAFSSLAYRRRSAGAQFPDAAEGLGHDRQESHRTKDSRRRAV